MANKRAEPLSYRPFQAKGAMAEGLLPVARPGLESDIEQRLAQGWFRLAGLLGEKADQQVTAAYAQQGVKDALNTAPGQVVIDGGGKTGMSAGLNAGGKSAPRSVQAGAQPLKTSDPVAQGLEPHQMAFLNAVAGGESGGRYNIRYTPQGGVLFDDLSKHPRILEPTKGGKKSSAAGRYQFTATTWDALGGGEFSPENQDWRAWQLATQVYRKTTGRDLDADLKRQGLTPAIVQALGNTWEAFKHGADRHIATYQASMERYRKGGAKAQKVGDGDDVSAKSAVGAPAIEPVVEPVAARPSMRVTQAGKFKQLPGTSVAARAYNAAGTRTYLQMLDVAVKADIMNLYDKFGHDPAEFDKGLAALQLLHKSDHAIPDEILGDYQAAFARAALPLQRQARLDEQKRIEAQNLADFNARTRDLETERSRRLAAVSLDNELGIDSLMDMQASLDEHYEAGVLHGVLTPVQADAAKALSRRQAALSFYDKQAQGKSAAEIEAMRKEMARDFAQGRLAHLDGEGWQILDGRLAAAIQKAQTGAKKQASDYAQEGVSLLARLEAGYELDEGELSDFALKAASVPEGDRIRDQTMAKITIAQRIGDMGLQQASDYVRGLRDEMGKAPSAEEIELYEYAAGSLEGMRKMLREDPLTYAQAQGVIEELAGIDEELSVGGLNELVKERVVAGKLVGEHYGVRPRFFKQGEVEMLGEMMAKDAHQGAVLAAAIVDGAGGDVRAVLSEFGDKAPQILASGAILAMEGDAQAAVDVLAGWGSRNEEGKAYQTIPYSERQDYEREMFGAALDNLDEGEHTRITGAAQAIAKRRIYEQGIELKEGGGKEIYSQALQLAAGQVKIGEHDYGGFVRVKQGWFGGGGFPVLVDSGLRADRLEDLFAAIKPSDFADDDIKPVRDDGRGLPDGAFAARYPVAVEGGYRFSETDPRGGAPEWVKGSDGQVFVFDPYKYKDVLMARVPGAFRP